MKKVVTIIGTVVILGALVVWATCSAKQPAYNVKEKGVMAVTAQKPVKQVPPIIRPFEVNMVAGMVLPSEPTINPSDPYDPMPLRIGTIGATTFHRPFCPYAKQSLVNHGLEKRINYWTRGQVSNSGRPGDEYCMAAIFDCSDMNPEEFVLADNDPWCGANIRRDQMDIIGIDAAIAGKTLCNLQGYIGIFVDDPEDCVAGKIRASSPNCDRIACRACTVNCEIPCDGCVAVMLAPINKVTFGMGDANQDGQQDIDDYLFYHECYSGPIAATVPCQNVFDFDDDADVDVTDFDLFVNSYNSGNESWAAINHPTAVVNQPKPQLPLRVGTNGSVFYHRLNCSAVNASWQHHGIEKRVDFYTWGEIEKSARIPDTNVCLPGTRDNPSGSLQDCNLDDDGDGMLNCHDECPEDSYKTQPGICGCGVSDQDSDYNGIPDCNDPQTIYYHNSFDPYNNVEANATNIGTSPTNWIDTDVNYSLNHSSLFAIVEMGAFAISSDQANIHSHYALNSDKVGYIFSGRFMTTAGDIGVTFFSDYPNSDKYYRLRSSTSVFGVDARGTSITSVPSSAETGVLLTLNEWYRFKIRVRGTLNSGTEIFAKVWLTTDAEPAWQVHCFDNSATKLTQGTFGIWTNGAGSRYWDDFSVTNY